MAIVAWRRSNENEMYNGGNGNDNKIGKRNNQWES
jgi:hypothetical protein